MTPVEISLVVALVQAGITVVEDIIAAVNSAKATGNPWTALAAETVEQIDAGLKLPVDVAAAILAGK